MIVPIINGILSYKKAPVTWLLFLLNIFFFVLSSEQANVFDKKIEALLKDDYFLRTQGKIFASFINERPERYSKMMRNLSQKVQAQQNSTMALILGSYAFRDQLFSQKFDHVEGFKDEVAYGWWKKKYLEYISYQQQHPNHIFGLSSSHASLDFWVSYQFFHSGFAHIFGNMVFLLIIGSVLEPVLGSVFFMLFYLMSGMIAAGAFMLLSGFTPMPLVGASGSISAIFSLFCVLFWKRPVRYFYFLLWPTPNKEPVNIGALKFNRWTYNSNNYIGYVYLPAWVALMLWFAGDLTGFLKAGDGVGGVAYTAHIGGELVGALCGFVLLFVMRWKYHNTMKSDDLPATRPIWSTEPLSGYRENKKAAPRGEAA